MEGVPETGDQSAAENNLKMNIRYFSSDGKAIDPVNLQQGTDFIAEVTLTNPGIKGEYKELALTQVFPSGWEIQNTRMTGTIVKGSDIPEYQDFRDDRVLTYFDLPANKSKTFRVMLNASYLGKYYLPTVSCEAMYDNSINARKPGQWVNVVKQSQEVSLAE
jgi:alpha-2-macroglobulin